MRQYLHALLLIFTIPLLAACHFKPHTIDSASLATETFYVDSSHETRAFSHALAQAIQHKNLKLTDDAKLATIAFKIAETNVSIQSPSFNASNKMRIYPLAFSVEYSVMKDHAALLANQEIVLNKNVVVRANETLTSNAQLKQLMQHVYQETAEQLLTQLAIKSS